MQNYHQHNNLYRSQPYRGNASIKREQLLGDLHGDHKSINVVVYQNYAAHYGLFSCAKRIGFMLEIPPNAECSPHLTTTINNLFANFLPLNSKLQVMLFADSNFKNCLRRWHQVKQGSIMECISNKTCDQLQKYAFRANGDPYILRDFRIIISFVVQAKPSIESLANIYYLKLQMQHKLQMFGFPSISYTPSNLNAILDNIFNINATNITPQWGGATSLGISQQPPDNNAWHRSNKLKVSLKVSKNQLLLHGNQSAVRTYQVTSDSFWSLRDLVGFVSQDRAAKDLSHLPCPFVVNYEIHHSAKCVHHATTASPHNAGGLAVPKQSSHHNTLNIILLSSPQKLLAAEQALLQLPEKTMIKLHANQAQENLHQFLQLIPMRLSKLPSCARGLDWLTKLA